MDLSDETQKKRSLYNLNTRFNDSWDRENAIPEVEGLLYEYDYNGEYVQSDLTRYSTFDILLEKAPRDYVELCTIIVSSKSTVLITKAIDSSQEDFSTFQVFLDSLTKEFKEVHMTLKVN